MKGRVKFFDLSRGFGFILGEDGQDYYVHRIDISPFAATRDLVRGELVSFEPFFLVGKDRLISTKVMPENVSEDRVSLLTQEKRFRSRALGNYLPWEPARWADQQLEIIEFLEREDREARQEQGPTSFSSFQTRDTANKSEDFLSQVANHIELADPAVARLLSLRVFGGLTLREIAAREGQPVSAIRRDWIIAKEWIQRTQHPHIRDLSESLITLAPIDADVLKLIYNDPDLLRTLDWRTFEKLLAELLGRLGFEIELQRGTKDGGIDIFALRRDGALGPHKYIIQAKRWSRRVGVSPVRELLFLQDQFRVSKACLATTASFTRGAWQLAGEYRWKLELRDLEGIKDWVGLATGMSPDRMIVATGKQLAPNSGATPAANRALRGRRR